MHGDDTNIADERRTEGGPDVPMPEGEQTPAELDFEPVPTDFRRNIWVLITIVIVVLAAWLVDRIAGIESPGEIETQHPAGRFASAGIPLARGSRTPLLGGAETGPLRFAPARKIEFLEPEDRVVVLSVGEELRAYPTRLLQVHAGLCDTVGGRNVFVCWSNFTQLARCLETPAAAARCGWEKPGTLLRGNTAFRDVATHSLWDSFSGRAIAGPKAGEALPRIPVAVHPWLDWQETHGDAPVLTLDSTPDELRRKGVYGEKALHAIMGYLASPDLPITSSADQLDLSPLPAKAFVLGFAAGPYAKAYPLEAMLKRGYGTIPDQVGSQTVHVHVTSRWTAHATGEDGSLLDAPVMLWFGWKLAHPRTEVWSPGTP